MYKLRGSTFAAAQPNYLPVCDLLMAVVYDHCLTGDVLFPSCHKLILGLIANVPYAYCTWCGLCVCVLGTWVSCAKMAELIVSPFGGQTRVGPKKLALDSPWEGALLSEEIYWHTVTYLQMSSLGVVCLPNARG